MPRSSKGRRQSVALALLVTIQTIAAAFFVGDAFTDLLEFPGTAHALVEAMVTVALVLGILIGGWQLRLTLDSMREQGRSLETARGELARIVDTQFEVWGLTSAESDVGRLALKGLDAPAIARIRNAAPGTVRAQLTRVYAKAGVSGREQFMAWFFEDLMHERLLPPEGAR
uniref:helix-turn-helix transcriptional regulator n=1 Tax=Sinorhizobium chiapasense TaxID=501572 RepID=UPI002FDF1DCB